MPQDLARPSTFTAAMVRLLRTHNSFRLERVHQVDYGALAMEPTGAVTVNFHKLWFCTELVLS